MRDELARVGACVIEAPPGAGKTTRVPPLLLEREGDVLVLEPRRMAARLAARRVAEERGEALGETVGYAVRFEEVRSARTRLCFVTEGILTRRLTRDPQLAGVSGVVLDELHERHVHTDVALALVRRLRKTSRPDLAVIAMSATLDTERVAKFLEAPVVRSEGRPFPVTVVHEDAPDDRPLELRVASAVRRALGESPDGHVLVFLPGAAEIRRGLEACTGIAEKHAAWLLPLHGDLPVADQDRAVLPSRTRKVVLSTNVAESSVTIDDVVAVVDSGLVRRSEHSPYTGLASLRVEKASRASCVQRAGRAGRTRPGHVYRLYARADFDARPEQEAPEIQRIDLAPTLLELLATGAHRDLVWLDAPSENAMLAAEGLLARLGAIVPGGTSLTELGRRMLALPLHPRLARVVLDATERGVVDDGVTAAALLGERDIRIGSRLGGKNRDTATDRSDVLAMMDAFHTQDDVDRAASRRADLARKQIRRAVSGAQRLHGAQADDALLTAVVSGYADRVAKRLSGRSFAMAGGKAELAESSVVRDAPLVVVVDAEARGASTWIRVASEVTPEQLVELAPDRITDDVTVEWNDATERAERVLRVRYDGLVIEERRGAATGAEAHVLLLAHAKAMLASDDDLATLRRRASFAHAVDSRVPLVDDTMLDESLATACDGRSALAELAGVRVADLVRARLPRALDDLAPERISLPSGRSARIVYEVGKEPFVASRLQDFFGWTETPRIGGGRLPLVLHLLAPNRRAVQVTTDLAGFWERHYPKLRRELMRRYPRHAWPEEPRRLT